MDQSLRKHGWKAMHLHQLQKLLAVVKHQSHKRLPEMNILTFSRASVVLRGVDKMFLPKRRALLVLTRLIASTHIGCCGAAMGAFSLACVGRGRLPGQILTPRLVSLIPCIVLTAEKQQLQIKMHWVTVAQITLPTICQMEYLFSRLCVNPD